MLITKTLPVKVTKKNISKYQGLGYQNLKLNSYTEIKIEDMNMSNRKAIYECDYCHTHNTITVADYNRRISYSGNRIDCCKNCFKYKTKDVTQIKYGVDNVFQLNETKEKIVETNLTKYGVENAMQCNDVNSKYRKTSLERYGVEYPMQNREIAARAITTYYKNNTTPTSKQQAELFDMISNIYVNSTYLNYPLESISIDIAIFLQDKKIAIEYDGWYWHRDQQRDIRKSRFLTDKKDWYVIRIHSGHLLPTSEQINKAINNILFNNKKHQIITLNDWVDY